MTTTTTTDALQQVPPSGVAYTARPGVEFVYITESAHLGRALAPLFDAPLLAVDTETTGLLAHRDKLLLLQLYAEGHPMVVIDCRTIPLDVVAEHVRPILTGRGALKVLHNAAFD